jgi:hypothetical protein
MLKQIRQHIIDKLWRDYYKSNDHVKRIEKILFEKNIRPPALDHLAIIDLPGPHTGISELSRIFTAIGYAFQGKDYLPEKQNDFTWMAECDSVGKPVEDVLPQVVVADFRLDELPQDVRNIISQYSSQALPSPAGEIEALAQRAANHDSQAEAQLLAMTTAYFSGRDWPLPTVKEFATVHAFNELLAWVLVFGRRPNHFTFSIHLMPEFESLASFHQFIHDEVGLNLNQDGGAIKGGKEVGIEQGSTAGTPAIVTLADGSVELPMDFVEFVWRFKNKNQPVLWEDYYTGFVATHANQVIQSLYTKD